MAVPFYRPAWATSALASCFAILSVAMLAGCDRLRSPTPPAPSTEAALQPAVADAVRPGGVVLGQPVQFTPGRQAAGPRVQIFPGSEVVAGAIPTPADREPGDVNLNFAGADVRDVVRAILGETLGQNFIVDPRIQAQITLQTYRPLPRTALLQVLEDVLRLNGMALLRSGEVYSVVPAGDGRGVPMPASAGVRVVPLSFVAATEMAGMLRGLVPNETVIRPIAGRNVLLLAGNARDVAAAVDLVSVFDVDWLAGMSTALFRPRTKDARTLRNELAAIVGGDRAAASAVRLVAMPSLNAVLAIARSQQLLRQVGTWVERLDQAAETAEQRIFVYNVQHGRASELASIVSRLFGISVSAAQGAGAQGPAGADLGGGQAPFQEPRADAGVGLGAPAAGLRGTPFPQAGRGPGIDAQAAPRAGGDAGQGAQAAGSADVTEIGGAGLGPQGQDSRIKVIADESNNALIILASPSDYRMIEGALEKLDIAPQQVLIEAAVAEVTLTDELRYGIQWFLRSGKFSATLSNSNGGFISQVFPGFAAVFQNVGINVVLSALDAVTQVRVVSSPSIMVLNNRSANLLVGDQVPIATQQAISTLAIGAPLINTITYRDTGVILKVTPRVNANGWVNLEINQEVSDVTRTTTSDLTSPTIQQRRFNSTLNVRSGETIALGGLIRDRRETDNAGVPLLKDIPGLGALFGTRDNKSTRTEVLVLLTPTVVRSDAEIREATEALRNQLSNPSFPTIPRRAPRTP